MRRPARVGRASEPCLPMSLRRRKDAPRRPSLERAIRGSPRSGRCAAAPGWLELESALVVVGDGLDPVDSLVGELRLPLHRGTSPPLSALFAACDAENLCDEIVRERLTVVLNQP